MKKLKQNMHQHKYLTFISCFIIVLIIFLSIGFAAFSQKLDINLAATVRPRADIRITDFQLADTSNGAYSSEEDFNISRIKTHVNLPTATSSVKYKIEVTNLGNVEMGILSMTGLPENLEITLEDYQLEEKICVDGSCQLGIKKVFYLTISYRENGYQSDNTDYIFALDFAFRSFHPITYTDFKVNTASLPQEVIDGGNLKIKFPPEIKEENLELYLSGTKIPFTWEDNTLIYNEVTTDVEIKYVTKTTEKNEYYAMMEKNSQGSDSNINFYDENTLETGIFMYDESKNDEFPIYYYRGNIEDNNVIYAGHCWKVVRTTEYGGIKIVYNGEIQSGNTCTGHHARLGTEPYNGYEDENASPAEVGYMYDLVINYEEIKPLIPVNVVFGNDVSWDEASKTYTLVDTITVTNLNDLEDDIRGGEQGNYKHETPNAFHYTCVSTTNTCETVYYVYYNNYGEVDEAGTGLYAVPLNNGLNIQEALAKMLYDSDNKLDSLAKYDHNGEGDYVDSWFANESNINVNQLDDVVWCNDRSIGGYHGWDKDTDNHYYDNKYLHFEPYRRLVEDQEKPILSCSYKNDNFTVNDTVHGNGDLTYPVALLTADEIILAGAIPHKERNFYLVADSGQWTMTPYYFSDDNSRIFYLSSSGQLYETYPYNGAGIRPAIALKSTFHLKSGDGTSTNPYMIEF